MNVARPNCSPIKRGTSAAYWERFEIRGGDKARLAHVRRKLGHRPCPYRGLMAAGWRAYWRGEPNPYSGPPSRFGKNWAWWQGYTKAKLAHEQGKPAL